MLLRLETACSTRMNWESSLLCGAFQAGSPPAFETGTTRGHLQQFNSDTLSLALSHIADELRRPAETEFQRHLHSASCQCCLFAIPDYLPTATELFQSPLYGSVTVFRSVSHLFRHFLSSALA